MCRRHNSEARAKEEKEMSVIRGQYRTGEIHYASKILTKGTQLIYAIRSVEFIDAVKIGTTNNIKKRFSAIQGCSPIKLSLMGTIPGGFDVENKLHRVAHKERFRGEWFDFSGEAKKIAIAIQAFDLHYIYEKIKFEEGA